MAKKKTGEQPPAATQNSKKKSLVDKKAMAVSSAAKVRPDRVISVDIAERFLTKRETEDELAKYEAIEDAAAEILSKCSKKSLILNGLTSLSDAAAKSLSNHKGDFPFFFSHLSLNGLTSLSDAVAESLSKHQGHLSLNRLTSLSDAAAESLSKHHGQLSFNSLTSLSDAAAESLSKHQGRLSINGLTSLSDAAAESLSKHEDGLELRRLPSLSDAAAEALCGRDERGDKFSQLIHVKLAAARQRLAKAKRASSYPELVAARRAGATLLRTVWNGHGDDGCFEHGFYRDGRPLKTTVDPNEEIAQVFESYSLPFYGEGEGSVGILLVDLTTGECRYIYGGGEEQQRLAEFVELCSLGGCRRVRCEIDQDTLSLSRIAVQPKGCVARRNMRDRLERLFDLLGELQCEYDGSDLITQALPETGKCVLTVDIEKRKFTISTGEETVTIKANSKALKQKTFKLRLG